MKIQFTSKKNNSVQDADTNTDRSIKRRTSSGDAASDADYVKPELFFSDGSEIEPIVKTWKTSAFDSTLSELKLVDENKTKELQFSFIKFSIQILFLLVRRLTFSTLTMSLNE